MSLSEIISDALRYPLGDKENFKYIALLFLLVGLPLAGIFLFTDLAILGFDSDSMMGLIGIISLLGSLLAFILALIVPGYSISVIREGIEQSELIPSLDIGQNIVDTIKLFVISFVYSIIPTIIIFILLMFVGGMASVVSSDAVAAIGVLGLLVMLICLIIAILFELFYSVGMMRFAEYDSISEALNISEVFEDLKEIGIINLILVLIVLGIINSILIGIGYALCFIPLIGGLAFGCLILPFILLSFHYALGLLYSDIV